jgi:pyruvate dehydrogenase E2 component (dihydrolipoamide acetyltransferase)
MPIEIIVPRSGWSMEEGTFAGWLKQPGEQVNVGDRVFALESDKAVEEAESMDAGVLWIPPDAPKTGDRVKVGQLLGYLLAAGEQPPESATGASVQERAARPAAAAPARSATPTRAPTELGSDIGGDAPPRDASAERSAAPVAAVSAAAVTPRARRAARERSVDLSSVTGTGRGGRIRERDVPGKDEDNGTRKPPAAEPRPEPARREAAPVASASSLAITPVRRTIAERMLRSLAETAPVTLTTRAEASQLVSMRSQLKAVLKAPGSDPGTLVPSYTEIIIKLVAKALRRHPLLAGRWEIDRIVLPSAMNIGISVDTEEGLVVPVLRDVENLALPELTRRARELVDAARLRRVKGDDLLGGVFTVTSLGSYGIDAFTPIINYPQTAILGVGAIRKEAGVTPQGQFCAREIISLSLTFDHRIVDGAPAAAFLQTLCEGIQSPFAWALADVRSIK